MSQFRILDLGAHDGFVTNFLARRAKQVGLEVHIDGVEANPRGVELFNERMTRDGIAGECVQGLAEGVPDLFEPYSYDAVVAFELLEHVPHVERFLDVAEDMCKPDGRVYISTPNGTFGSGQNPHHLRVWTMLELFDLLRRRGHVHNAMPGPDGVSVIAYQPMHVWKQKEVGIYVGPGWETWGPLDIEQKGLGGSETAAVRLAEQLSKQGCRVTVYGEVTGAAVGQVLYRPHTAFDPTDERDLLIVSRLPEVFARLVNAERSLLWLHDTDCLDRLTAEHMQYIDKIMCLSHWHQGHLLETYPFLTGDQVYVTRNGIEPSYFLEGAPKNLERNTHRAVYSSSPDRGLDLLLEWWPEVRERVPDAELYYCYASVYDAVAEKNPQIADFRNRIQKLAAQDGVVNVGSQNQPSLAKLMMGSGVWLAPSYSTPSRTPFMETFCIGAVEAAAAGCHRVMSRWGALEERDEGDLTYWVEQDYDGKPNKEQFVNAIVDAMQYHPDRHAASSQALEMDWAEVAADMLAAAFQEAATPVG